MRLFALALCLPLMAGAVDLIQTEFPTPEALNAAIPAPTTPTGEAIGERHWYSHEIHAYLQALAEASPRMVALPEYARSHGGRPLRLYAISSPTNLARLDTIQAAQQASWAEGAPVPDDQPVILNMGYGVHGNEPSATNVAPLVAYYLTATETDAVAALLENVLVLIDPLLNPDGFDRFAHWSNSQAGRNPSADPEDREHNEMHPTGRTNFYGFDLNRDWLPMVHPESEGRVRAFHRWKPHVLLDFHEMGTNATYFFQPGVPLRTNPLTPDANQELTNRLADFHREAFDAAGMPYYSQERFDDFYVGKGSTYPDLHGTGGILFEQASSRGMQQESINGLVTLPQTIANQFRASLSSLTGTHALAHDLRAYQHQFWADAREAGNDAGGYYLAAAPHDPAKLADFVRVLTAHGLRVEGLRRAVEIDEVTYRPGEAIAISTRQPAFRYLQSLWERRTEFAENIFYDVSAWTLPLAYDLQHTPEPYQRRQKDRWLSGPLTAEDLLVAAPATPAHAEATGYLLDWRDTRIAALTYDLLAAQANLRVATGSFSIPLGENADLTDFPAGTLFLSRLFTGETAWPSVSRVLDEAMADGLPIHPVHTAHTPGGIDLGSPSMRVLEKPEVAILVGAGIDQYEAAEFWHLFDTRVEMPVTRLDLALFGGTDLDRYSHLLIGDGWALRRLPEAVVEKITQWVQRGGVLWLQGDAVRWAIDHELVEATWQSEDATDDDESTPERRAFSAATNDNAFKLVRGAIFSAHLDRTHPLGYGFPRDMLPMFRNKNRFLEPSDNPYSTPVRYTEEPLLAGYISEENLRLASDSASVIVEESGNGAIVLCIDNPLFRGYWHGTQRLLLNAVFFGNMLEEPRY